MMKLLIGISGASGAILGCRMLKTLHAFPDIETHLILTDGAMQTIESETNFSISDVTSLANRIYDNTDISAPVASGSYQIDAMIIIPCSMKTVAGIASGYADNLLLRAADVTIKEGRPLIIVPRESPLSRIHLRNIKECVDNGVLIYPPMLTFYGKDISIDTQIDNIIGRILMRLGIDSGKVQVWDSK